MCSDLTSISPSPSLFSSPSAYHSPLEKIHPGLYFSRSRQMWGWRSSFKSSQTMIRMKWVCTFLPPSVCLPPLSLCLARSLTRMDNKAPFWLPPHLALPAHTVIYPSCRCCGFYVRSVSLVKLLFLYMGHGQVEYKYLISSIAGNIIRRHVRKRNDWNNFQLLFLFQGPSSNLI